METLTDIITGQPLPDREDEPIRQAAEKLLLDLGYTPEQVQVEATRCLQSADGPLEVRADLVVSLEGQAALLLRCVRGSLVSRERESIAAARLISDPWVPLALVFNGQDATLLETAKGRVLDSGLDALPPPEELARLLESHAPHHPSTPEITKAARVYSAFAFIQCPSQCCV